MNTNQINELLEKYYEGETTLEEERLLKSYLRENEKKQEYLPARLFLDYCGKEAEKDILKPEILEKATEKLTIEDKVVYTIRKLNGWKIFTVAASIVFIMLTGYFIYENLSDKPKSIIITNENLNQNNNKEIAFQETKKAFTIVSRNMDLATKKMEKLNYMNKGNSGLSKIDLLNTGKQ